VIALAPELPPKSQKLAAFTAFAFGTALAHLEYKMVCKMSRGPFWPHQPLAAISTDRTLLGDDDAEIRFKTP
jgi:hypothetical protein